MLRLQHVMHAMKRLVCILARNSWPEMHDDSQLPVGHVKRVCRGPIACAAAPHGQSNQGRMDDENM